MRDLPGQPLATVMLRAAIAHPRHAYLFWGPRGAGKNAAAGAFIAELLACEPRRVTDESHPDLFVVEPEGEAILIDQVRALREDLHLRPFEADRRVYLLREAETLGRDAANALLKSLEEPPAYAIFVLCCNDRSRLLPTITSRCQQVRFRTPPPDAVLEVVGDAPDAAQAARLARGNLDLARRLAHDAAAREQFATLLDLARDAALRDDFDASEAVRTVIAFANAAGGAAQQVVDAERSVVLSRVGDAPQLRRERARLDRVYDALAKRRRRRAETDELRVAADTVSGYFRDVACVAVGADATVVSSDRLPELGTVASRLGLAGAVTVLERLTETRRSLDLPVVASLAMERLFSEIRLTARP